MPLPIPVILALSAACAPSVSPTTLAAIVQTESGGAPLAIGINGHKPVRLHPQDRAHAIRAAGRLLAEGANLDLGLGQINRRNLAALKLSVADAFDPCRNLTASAQIIATDYARTSPIPGAEQRALRTSLSLYNTGDPERGFRNGYVAKVAAAAQQIVPALNPTTPPRAAPSAEAISKALPQSPPVWDVFGQASAATATFVFSHLASGKQP